MADSNFTIEFNQPRPDSRLGFDGYTDKPLREFFGDVAEYQDRFMIAGPFENVVWKGRRACTAMGAFVDRHTGKLNVETRIWHKPLFALMETRAIINGSREYLGSFNTLDQAKEQLRIFEKACETQGYKIRRSPSAISCHFLFATRLVDTNLPANATPARPSNGLNARPA